MVGVVVSQNPARKVSDASAPHHRPEATRAERACILRKKAGLPGLFEERSMTAVVIALAVIAWLIVLLLCLGLARSAALGDALMSGRTRGGGRRGREAA